MLKKREGSIQLMLNFNAKTGKEALIEGRRRVEDELNDDEIQGTNYYRDQRRREAARKLTLTLITIAKRPSVPFIRAIGPPDLR